MAETIKAGWLTDKDGNKFAPKTITSQIINGDGTLLTESLNASLTELETTLKNYTDEQIANLEIPEGGGSDGGNADHAATADTATKAIQDGNGNVITDTYETKTDATTKFNNAKAYVDAALEGKADDVHLHAISDVVDLQGMLDDLVENINNKSSVQLIIWEEND